MYSVFFLVVIMVLLCEIRVSWPDTAVKPGFTGPAESQTRVQTAENNRKQGSEGANGVRRPANTRRGFPG